ncbi:MAG TPA: substrate-binding domain-containing protein [Steroidobacteraceae bacterium]|nr:substrate-binding domain-containing protein [Steroidobacteraceae bacterium]
MVAELRSANALQAISSMATAALLRALIGAYQERSGQPVELISIGGVDALRRVMDGEQLDLVVLAADAIERLSQHNRLLPGSPVALVRSSVAAAVPAGAPHPDIGSEQALRDAVLAAAHIGYSTGPSGTALVALLQRWGIDEQVRPRLVQARPGVPVGSLVASGQVSLGFQQLSELQSLPGVELLGELPAACAIETIFSAAICRLSQQPTAAGALLTYLNSSEAAPIKRQHGMSPA